MYKVLTATCFATAFSASSAVAITLDGIDFDDNAFADTILAVEGISSTFAEVEAALTDADPNTGIRGNDDGAAGFITLGFTDNVVTNGTGVDLAIFEGLVPDSFGVSVNGQSRINYTPVDTGTYNIAQIDLSDFGVGLGVSISEVTIFMDKISTFAPTIELVGAINSGATQPGNPDLPDAAPIPLPASFPLLVGGVALLGWIRSRRRVSA